MFIENNALRSYYYFVKAYLYERRFLFAMLLVDGERIRFICNAMKIFRDGIDESWITLTLIRNIKL